MPHAPDDDAGVMTLDCAISTVCGEAVLAVLGAIAGSVRAWFSGRVQNLTMLKPNGGFRIALVFRVQHTNRVICSPVVLFCLVIIRIVIRIRLI